MSWQRMTPNFLEFKHIRSHKLCPLCEREKGIGPVVCWPCYRSNGLRYGNLSVNDKLREIEREWEAMEIVLREG